MCLHGSLSGTVHFVHFSCCSIPSILQVSCMMDIPSMLEHCSIPLDSQTKQHNQRKLSNLQKIILSTIFPFWHPSPPKNKQKSSSTSLKCGITCSGLRSTAVIRSTVFVATVKVKLVKPLPQQRSTTWSFGICAGGEEGTKQQKKPPGGDEQEN